MTSGFGYRLRRIPLISEQILKEQIGNLSDLKEISSRGSWNTNPVINTSASEEVSSDTVNAEVENFLDRLFLLTHKIGTNRCG